MMKKSSARLRIKSNLSPSTPPTELPGTEGTNSATLAKAERQIKLLQEENKKLKDDFSEISTMYHQLVREASDERYDERRVVALKAQMIQLERQVVVMATAHGARADTLMEVENALAGIANCARSHLEEEKAVGASVGSISLPRSQLMGIVESAESARIKLYKSIESSNPDKLERPLLMMDRFVKQSPWQPVTLMDVCSGKLEHLNLKHVSKLEGQLAQLYKQLVLVNRGLYSLVVIGDGARRPGAANKEVPAALYDRLGDQVSQACTQLNTVTRDLLDLTLLVPAAPWPPLQRPCLQELTTDDVMRALPNFPRAKAAEGRHLVEALLKCYTLNNHMASLENQALCEELKFHQAVYDLQQEYTQNLLAALSGGYTEFEASTQKLLCQPLAAILGNYSVLRDEATEEALREFLAVFKQHADQLEDAVQILNPDENKMDEGGGKAALSQFGEEFLKSLDVIHKQCQQKRDKLISDLEDVKGQHKGHVEEMKEMFQEPERNPGDEPEEITQKTDELEGEFGGDTPKACPKRIRQADGGMAKAHHQGTDARGRRRSSLRAQAVPRMEDEHKDEPSVCSCAGDGSEEGGEHVARDLNGSGTSTPTDGTPPQGLRSPQMNHRPTTLGGLTLQGNGTERRTPPVTPKTSRLPSRGTPTSGGTPSLSSRIPTTRSRSAHTPGGATPGSYSRGRNLPGGRLAPIAKLNLKPKPKRDSSPIEKPLLDLPEWQS